MPIPRLRNMTSLYLLRDNRILLLHREGGRVANNLWVGSAGGHFEPDELNDPERCIMRELYEELALTDDDIFGMHLRYITLRMTNNEIRQNYFFFASLNSDKGAELQSNEGSLKWFDFGELSEVKMSYSGRKVIEHYLETGRYNEKIYTGTAYDSGMIFTELPEQE